jgi:MurNAc alpha-1-phosphate uridylyltransferase
MSLQAVILAGGLATRMWPRTKELPKSLLDVAGRPFIDRQLERLAILGFERVVLCIGYLGGQIRAHVGDGAKLGLHVDYSEDGQVLLGTGGALRAALHLLDSEFLLTYGDSWLPFDYAAPLLKLRAHDDCDGVMSVYENDGQWDASNVFTEGDWIGGYRKGTADARFNCIDYGAIALRRLVVEAMPSGQALGLDALLSGLAAHRHLRAYVAHERFYEIGSPEGLESLERMFRHP